MICTPHWPVPLGHKPIDLGLERIRELLHRLGNPETKLPPVIHIAGTNGKGSTLAFLRAMLEAAGYRVHVYTSPHLIAFNERMVLAGKPIGDDLLYEALEECRKKSHGISITFFEGTTAAAFLAFSRTPADIVLLETGLGGRLDATNVVEKPVLTIITPISKDHMEYLGDTLAQIASEKAAIMKPGVPCLSSTQKKIVVEVLENFSERIKAPLFMQGSEWDIRATKTGLYYHDKLPQTRRHPSASWDPDIFRKVGWMQPELTPAKAGAGMTPNLGNELLLPFPSLPGKHQYHNAGLAVAALGLLKDFSVSEAAIVQGLQSVQWPGRLQKLKEIKGCEVWLDGAHNPDGARVLAAHVKAWQRSTYLVVGMLKNRNPQDFLKPFTGHVAGCYAVPIPQENCHEPYNIAAAAQALGIDSHAAINVEEAVRIIAEKNLPCQALICGSLYLAGSVLEENG